MALGAASLPLKHCDVGVWKSLLGAEGEGGCLERIRHIADGESARMEGGSFLL